MKVAQLNGYLDFTGKVVSVALLLAGGIIAYNAYGKYGELVEAGRNEPDSAGDYSLADDANSSYVKKLFNLGGQNGKSTS